MPGKDEPCYLSALPPELIDTILIYLDSTRTLGNVITTSRFIYRRFTARPGPFILSALQNELGPVLADAQFLSRLSYTNPGSKPEEWIAHWDKMHDMAAIYKDLMCRGGDATDSGFAVLTRQCHTLYQMSLISDVYIAAQGRWFQAEGLTVSPPSRSERLRVLRALYRRQIICNAWAPTRREHPTQWSDQDLAALSNTSSHRGQRLGILAPLQPWELQQVDHVDRFVARLCLSLCLSGDEQGQPLDEAQFGQIFTHTDHLVQYVREHPTIADAAFSAVASLLRLSDRGAVDIAPIYGRFVDRYDMICLRYPWQKHRFDTLPDPTRDPHGEEEEEEDGTGTRICFTGDQVDLVPFGWVDALGGRYVNWFGDALMCIPGAEPAQDENLYTHYCSLQLWRSAGFALWDHQRVEAIKELDQLSIFETGWTIHEQ
ncbi:hypothetical protein FDECE_7516 [Fusarium decemcellulare]|nr:hypothetical protein FDECE_7516 [Fusarium decemcellulare]